MKIKVIFTGGTIGSRSDGEYIGLGGAPYVLIERWRKTHSGVDFECAEPYSILSEELTAENLAALARCVREQTDGADAVIITLIRSFTRRLISGLCFTTRRSR